MSIKPKLMLAKRISLDELREWSISDWEKHYIEPKIDGDRLCRAPNGEWLSKGGKKFYNIENIKDAIDKVKGVNELLLDGEVSGDDWSHTQSFLHTKRKKPKGKVRFIIFDAVPDDQPMLELRHRAAIIEKIVKEVGSSLVVMNPRYEVSNFDEFMDRFNECVASGCDGVMVKTKSGPYEYKRSKYWRKVKPYHEMDCKIVSFKQGKGKYSKTLGSIGVVIPLPKGKWSERVTNVSGMEDSERDRIWKMRKKLIGKIAEVRYREVTKVNRLKEPRLVRLRLDK